MLDNDIGSAADRSRMKRRFRKSVFVVPSLFTTANIFCGFYSIMESLSGAQALSLGDVASAAEHFDRAAINIGFAFLFDGLDGRIARMTGATTEFGLELDSIADVLSFGIAPALLAFTWGYGEAAQLHKVAWMVSFLFVICGALRLARFNVQARKPSPNLPSKSLAADKKAFVGMPIPVGASLIAAIVHFKPTPLYHIEAFEPEIFGRTFRIDGSAFAILLLVLVAFLAFLMVSTIRYASFKGMGARNYHPRILILGLALCVVTVWFYSRWALLIFSTFYASHGLVIKLWSLAGWKKRGPTRRSRVEMDGEAHKSNRV